MKKFLNLDKGWSVMQDVHDLGEISNIYQPGWCDTDVFRLFSEWEEIDYLSHLQLIFSDMPYFGRELRYFNHAPWWYRNTFLLEENTQEYAGLRFEGVDYYCKVWLNGHLVGEHEGYSSPFEFEAGNLLLPGEENLLIVKVSSPWDDEVLPGEEQRRVHMRVCGMMKGTYEHDDTFIQRDVNPIGIWNKVALIFHDKIHMHNKMKITALPVQNYTKAEVKVSFNILCLVEAASVTAHFIIREVDTGRKVVTQEIHYELNSGENTLGSDIILDNPRIWEIYERGIPNLYELVLEMYGDEELIFTEISRFGVRKVDLIRNKEKIQFNINGKNIFLRGTSYFPEVYISKMSKERYCRDITAARQAGFNAVRVHVHVARQEFYDVCDELGMLVIQDSDFNWVHPVDEEWTARAVSVFSDMVNNLYNHPAIFCWVCMNEPQYTPQRDFINNAPGPQLVAALKKLDPWRPYIKASCYTQDPESGDTHDYTGAFGDETVHYLDYDVTNQRLNTEFGCDSPPVAENLRTIPKIYKRLKSLETKLPSLQYYQYRLLKHIVESFRLSKYEPCSGYFQFMFIDLCPQSFYGVYDWWGVPKEGLRAMLESNQPLAVILKIVDEMVQLWVVNDLPKDMGTLTICWTVTDEHGNTIEGGEVPVEIAADSLTKVLDIPTALDHGSKYKAYINLKNESGNIIAWNRYDDLLNHPAHPVGYSYRMSHEFGIRLFDA